MKWKLNEIKVDQNSKIIPNVIYGLMIKMMVKCKNCGFRFPSFNQINEVAFEEAAELSNNTEQCPSCSQMSSYNKEDYFFE